MIVQSNIKVTSRSGKFTMAELREFMQASNNVRSNAVVEIGLDEKGNVVISVDEFLLKQF